MPETEMLDQQVQLPVQQRALTLRAETFNPETRTVEAVWSTGARRTMFSWERWDYVDEELSLDPAHVRLERLNNGAPVLNTHMAEELEDQIGVVVPGTARIENGQGIATLQLSARESIAELVGDIQAGIIRNISVGYMVHQYEVTERPGEKPLMRATDWEPCEISFVPIPADPAATVRSADAPQGGFPCIVRRAVTSTPANPEARMSDTPTPAPAPAIEAPAPAPVEQRGAQPAAPAITADLIHARAKAAGLSAEATVALVALRDEGLIDSTETLALEIGKRWAAKSESRPNVAVTQVQVDESEKVRSAITSALLHRYQPSQYKLEGGAENWRGMTLLEIGRDLAARAGINVRGMSKMEIAGVMLGMRAGGGMHTTGDFPFILENIATKSLRDAYDGTPRTFAPFVVERTLPDFKQASVVSLGGAPALLPVAEHGEFTRGTMDEARERYTLGTFGRIVAVSRQALVNDDLDAFTRVPAAFGRAAADMESDAVYGILVNNPLLADGNALFTTGRTNLASTGTALSITSLGVGRAAMRGFTGIEGRPVNVTPRHLIVGPSNETAAEQLASTIVASQVTNVNSFARTLNIVADPRVTGTLWFLSADASDPFASIHIGRLEGQAGVYLETRTGFDVDGIEIKARNDFVAAPVDWRGLYRNPGA